MKATNCKVPNFGNTAKPNFAFCPPLNLHLNASARRFILSLSFFFGLSVVLQECTMVFACASYEVRAFSTILCLVELDLATFHFSQNVFFFLLLLLLNRKRKELLFKCGRKGDSLFPFSEQQIRTNKKLHAENGRMETLVLLGKLSRSTQTKRQSTAGRMEWAKAGECRGWRAGNRKQILHSLSNWEQNWKRKKDWVDLYRVSHVVGWIMNRNILLSGASGVWCELCRWTASMNAFDLLDGRLHSHSLRSSKVTPPNLFREQLHII